MHTTSPPADSLREPNLMKWCRRCTPSVIALISIEGQSKQLFIEMHVCPLFITQGLYTNSISVAFSESANEATHSVEITKAITGLETHVQLQARLYQTYVQDIIRTTL